MASRPEPSSSDVVRAFEGAMNQAGFYPRGAIQSDTNGFIRFDAPGDKNGKGNGFYKLKTGQYPVGWFGDWKIGEQHQWFYADPDKPTLTDKERAAIKREQAKLKAEAAQARETRQAEVAEDASNKWGRADGNVEGHPYLERKGINVPRSLRLFTARDGTRLLAVPMYAFDMNGAPQLTNLQLVDGDGKKTFLKGGRVEGTFFSIKGDASLIVICEGVATAFSIWQATGVSVVAAFNASNLVPVAKDFARHRPLATLMIAGDDDAIAPHDWAEKSNKGARGRTSAGRKPKPLPRRSGAAGSCPSSRMGRAATGPTSTTCCCVRASKPSPGKSSAPCAPSKPRTRRLVRRSSRLTGCRTKAGARSSRSRRPEARTATTSRAWRSTSPIIGSSRAGCATIS
jgi:putative DNA primase/helicase